MSETETKQISKTHPPFSTPGACNPASDNLIVLKVSDLFFQNRNENNVASDDDVDDDDDADEHVNDQPNSYELSSLSNELSVACRL